MGADAPSAPTDPAVWLAGLLDATGAARIGRKWQCVVHGRSGEHAVALSVGMRKDGTGAWIYCHGGCGLTVILAALRLSRADLRNPPPVPPARHAVAWRLAHAFPPPRSDRGGDAGWVATSITEHPYGDPETIAWKVRERNAAGSKRIHWESRNPRGERVPGLLGRREADLPLYRIREVRMAIAMEETVLLVESESSVDALAKAGLYATCWAGGAGSCPLNLLQRELADADVVLIPDHDEAGLKVAAQIHQVLPSARQVLGEPGEDARDLLQRLGAAGLTATGAATPPHLTCVHPSALTAARTPDTGQ